MNITRIQELMGGCERKIFPTWEYESGKGVRARIDPVHSEELENIWRETVKRMVCSEIANKHGKE